MIPTLHESRLRAMLAAEGTGIGGWDLSTADREAIRLLSPSAQRPTSSLGFLSIERTWSFRSRDI
jgi:hypothetical protein